MKVLVASDLHLSERIWSHKQILGDSYWSWIQIVKAAIDLKVDAVILAGDLLDKQANMSEPIRQLSKGLDILVRAGIKVYYNQGQHEFQENPWCGIVSSCQHVHKKSFDLGDVAGYGLDFQHAEELQTELKKIPKAAKVLVAHQVWADFMGDIARPQAAFSDIPKHIRLLITGDYHKSVVKQVGKLTVISPGSSHLRSVSEPVDKTFYVLESANTDTAAGFDIACHLLRTRRLYELDIQYKNEVAIAEQLTSMIADAQEYAETYSLPEDIRKPIVRIQSTASQHETTASIERAFKDRVHLFWKIKKETDEAVESMADLVQAASSDKLRMRDCLSQFVDAKEEPAVFELSSLLVDSLSPSSTLSQWVNSQLQEVGDV